MALKEHQANPILDFHGDANKLTFLEYGDMVAISWKRIAEYFQEEKNQFWYIQELGYNAAGELISTTKVKTLVKPLWVPDLLFNEALSKGV